MSRKSFLVLLVSLITSCVFASRGDQQIPPASSSRQTLARQVFDRYVNALGGRDAYARIISRSIKGKFEYNGSSQTTPESFEAQQAEGTVEMHWETPNRVAEALIGPPLAVKRGYDGKDAWGFHPQAGVRKISPSEITEIVRSSVLYQPIALSNYYTQISYDGKRRVDGPEVDIIEATTKDNRTERFYFDSSTGLPVRLDLWEEGPEGARIRGEYYLAQYYLSDYRIVDGIQVPFSIRRVRPHSTMIFTFTEVKQNIPLDDRIFEAPRQSSTLPKSLHRFRGAVSSKSLDASGGGVFLNLIDPMTLD